MDRDINCKECGVLLFTTDKSDGAAGSEALHKGFVFKIPILHTGQSGCLFFCNKKCQRSYYDKNIPKNPEADAKLRKFKENIPKMTTDLCNNIASIQKLLINKNLK